MVWACIGTALISLVGSEFLFACDSSAFGFNVD